MVSLGSIVTILIAIWSLHARNIKARYCFYGEGSDDHSSLNAAAKEIPKMTIILPGSYDKQMKTRLQDLAHSPGNLS